MATLARILFSGIFSPMVVDLAWVDGVIVLAPAVLAAVLAETLRLGGGVKQFRGKVTVAARQPLVLDPGKVVVVVLERLAGMASARRKLASVETALEPILVGL
jgi:hypothetical protein